MATSVQTTAWQDRDNQIEFYAMFSHVNCLLHTLRLLFSGSEERAEGRDLANKLFGFYFQNPRVFGSREALEGTFDILLSCWLAAVILLGVDDYEG
jgi:hypothetical protein